MTEQTRRALGDVTNLPKKRGISSILDEFLQKSGDESGKIVVREDSRPKFSKRLCLVVDDLVKENDVTEGGGGSSSDDKISSGDSYDKESDDGKEIYFEPGDKDGAIVLDASRETEDVVGGGEELGLGLSVVSSDAERCDPQGIGERLSECKNLRSFELRKCSNVEKNEGLNQNLGDDLLKSCSCSFCLKAAYMWSDLHYQDIKGRLSVLKKSQKEASNMIQRNGIERPMDFHASLNPDSALKLESKLMGQWRSLFLNMGHILGQENKQLENTFSKMKELREECRIDLERAMKAPQQHNTQ